MKCEFADQPGAGYTENAWPGRKLNAPDGLREAQRLIEKHSRALL